MNKKETERNIANVLLLKIYRLCDLLSVKYSCPHFILPIQYKIRNIFLTRLLIIIAII